MSLSNLVSIPGVSGDEHRVRKELITLISRYVEKIWEDSMGNLFAVKGEGRNGLRVMLCAHMDEVGLIITSIEKDGTLRFAKVGGIDDRVLPGVSVRIGYNNVPGIICQKPFHLKSPEERKKPIPFEELYIHIGASSEKETEKLVQPGDYVAFYSPYTPIHEDVVIGKAFDDRAGCLAIVEILKEPTKHTLIACFTVQEEIGLRGASVAAQAVNPDIALIFEGTTCADLPGTPSHRESTQLGKGPVISRADSRTIIHPRMNNALLKSALKESIPYQWKKTTLGGTDAGAIQYENGGIPCGILSVPCRYLHSPVSMLNLNDLENMIKLGKAFLKDISGREVIHD
jgi:putative aminopeptidase FrvX